MSPRSKARQALWVFGGKGYLLTTLCIDLRTRMTGGWDSWSPERVQEGLRILQDTLDAWEPTTQRLAPFDDAVRGLLQATIEVVHD